MGPGQATSMGFTNKREKCKLKAKMYINIKID